MSDQIVQLKLSDLRKLFKEVTAERGRPEYIPVSDFCQLYDKDASEVRYMRETTYPELFKKFKGRWKINISAYRAIAA